MIDLAIYLSGAAKLSPSMRRYVNHRFEEFYLKLDQSQPVDQILDGKMFYLDVGAESVSDGHLGLLDKYSRFFNVKIGTPEQSEVDWLQALGYDVIHKAFYHTSGQVPLFYTHAHASITRPLGPYLDFASAADTVYMSRYDVVDETRVECTTISDELTRLDIADLDMLNVSTDGSELNILQGLGEYRPLVITTQFQYLAMWNDIPSAYQVCQYLLDLGYIPFQLINHEHIALCPTYGFGLFMPSWVIPSGRELILANEEKYIALMLMFGQNNILHFVNQKLELRNKEFVHSLPHF
jgi:hypothetical protein